MQSRSDIRARREIKSIILVLSAVPRISLEANAMARSFSLSLTCSMAHLPTPLRLIERAYIFFFRRAMPMGDISYVYKIVK